MNIQRKHETRFMLLDVLSTAAVLDLLSDLHETKKDLIRYELRAAAGDFLALGVCLVLFAAVQAIEEQIEAILRA